MKKIIDSPYAPKAIGPYSQAILSNDTLYVSGQLPMNPLTNHIPESIEEQTLTSLTNIEAILKEAGLEKEAIVKTTVYLKDMNMFTQMNDVYLTFFGSHKPARATVEVARLPKDALVEIECIATK